jgi:hypothetical protein
MKDFRFLTGIAKAQEEIPIVMESLLAPFEGRIHAFHHDVTARGSHFIISYTIQLDVHSPAQDIQPKRDRSNKGRHTASGRA